MTGNVKFFNFRFSRICKKKLVKMERAIHHMTMNGDNKKSVNTAIFEFYKLNSDKGQIQVNSNTSWRCS